VSARLLVLTFQRRQALQGQLNAAYQEITQTLSLSQDKLAAQSARVFSLLVKYVADFAILVRTVKGSDLTRQEEETYRLLKEVLKAYEVAGNGGRMEGKLAEFWACILRLKQVVDTGYAANGKFDWSLSSEQELLRVSRWTETTGWGKTAY
jgi:bifunctional ADP-heptose synthase (sugar kinase/adenylyltransferase)